MNQENRYEKYSNSYKEAAKKYSGEGAEDKSTRKVESVRLRVPVGWSDLIKDRAKTLDKSVNKYLCDLIQEDIGIDTTDNK